MNRFREGRDENNCTVEIEQVDARFKLKIKSQVYHRSLFVVARCERRGSYITIFVPKSSESTDRY